MSRGVMPLLNSWLATASTPVASMLPCTASPRRLWPVYWKTGMRQSSRPKVKGVPWSMWVTPDAPRVTGVGAVGAAAPAPEGQRVGAFAQLGAQHGVLAGIDAMRLGATVADAPHQALRQDAAQAGGHEERRRAHVEQTRNGRNRIVGMQRGQHQMAGHGGAQADFGGLLVAHFADQDNVRVLAQHRAQHACECQLNFGIHLNLIDAVKTVLDRIFNRNNFVCRFV